MCARVYVHVVCLHVLTAHAIIALGIYFLGKLGGDNCTCGFPTTAFEEFEGTTEKATPCMHLHINSKCSSVADLVLQAYSAWGAVVVVGTQGIYSMCLSSNPTIILGKC